MAESRDCDSPKYFDVESFPLITFRGINKSLNSSAGEILKPGKMEKSTFHSFQEEVTFRWRALTA